VKVKNLQRGTAATAELGGSRHLHQLWQIARFFTKSKSPIVQCSYAHAAPKLSTSSTILSVTAFSHLGTYQLRESIDKD
jgi:hypothetical protein